MVNPNVVILILFIFGGLFATLWGLLIIFKARKTQRWPCVEGVIQESRLSSDDSDLLPHIQFSYTVGQAEYRRTIEFPADISPTQERARNYVEKYPMGARVQVYYNPDGPQDATLEPGLAQGDWLVLMIGLGMLILGIALFLFGS